MKAMALGERNLLRHREAIIEEIEGRRARLLQLQAELQQERLAAKGRHLHGQFGAHAGHAAPVPPVARPRYPSEDQFQQPSHAPPPLPSFSENTTSQVWAAASGGQTHARWEAVAHCLCDRYNRTRVGGSGQRPVE